LNEEAGSGIGEGSGGNAFALLSLTVKNLKEIPSSSLSGLRSADFKMRGRDSSKMEANSSFVRIHALTTSTNNASTLIQFTDKNCAEEGRKEGRKGHTGEGRKEGTSCHVCCLAWSFDRCE
jgi:hypothetical protein